MTYKPQKTEDIRESINNSLAGKIVKLTNFTERSFNYVFVNSISSYFRELELKILASELSAYIEYAGGPITNEDLRKLELDDYVDADELNPYMRDEQLDELVKIVGIKRNDGSYASGYVDIQTTESKAVTIKEGTTISTSPDADGNSLEFEIVEDRPSFPGQSLETDIPVQAVEIGEEYNISANEIQRFNSPPIGVRGIESSMSMSGGEGIEDNESLRERAKRAIAEEPTGGTVRGLKGYIVDKFENIKAEDIGITELFEKEPVVVEVTVDAAATNPEKIREAIEEGRPVGVKHELLTPRSIQISVDAQLLGDGIDTKYVENEVEDYLIEDLSVGNDFYNNRIIRELMTSDSNVINVDKLEVRIDSIQNERHEYDTSVDKYYLDYTYNGTGDVTLADSDNNVFERGVDYELLDDSGDGLYDTINWLGVSEPDNGENFFIDYSVHEDVDHIRDERHLYNENHDDYITFENEVSEYKLTHIPKPSTVSIQNQDGTTYQKGTDYEIINTSIGQSSDEFTHSSGRVTYELDQSVMDGSVKISIPDKKIFEKGVDYTVKDDNGDGLKETIEWLDAGSKPSNGENFVVEYDVNNGLEQTINWIDGQSSPPVGDTFTVSYEQGVYNLTHEVPIVREGTVSCSTKNTDYTYNTDFDFVDTNADTEIDSIRWIDTGSNPSDDVPFFVTYKSEGDLILDNQEKVESSKVTVTER